MKTFMRSTAALVRKLYRMCLCVSLPLSVCLCVCLCFFVCFLVAHRADAHAYVCVCLSVLSVRLLTDLIVTDAYDTMFMADENVFRSKLAKLNHPELMFSAECACTPQWGRGAGGQRVCKDVCTWRGTCKVVCGLRRLVLTCGVVHRPRVPHQVPVFERRRVRRSAVRRPRIPQHCYEVRRHICTCGIWALQRFTTACVFFVFFPVCGSGKKPKSAC